MTSHDADTVLAAQIAERMQVLNQRIAAATDRPDDVSIIAVSKRHPAAAVEAARSIGLRDFGENYAQELAGKAVEVADTLDGSGGDQHGSDSDAIRWHFVGGLQRNKIKLIADSVYLWQSIDRLALVRTLADRAPGAKLLVQVNTTDEAQKSGCSVADAPQLVEEAENLGLSVRGLMTIGPTEPGADPRPAFEALRTLRDRLARPQLTELSMGMSGDLELALAEGATMLRIGTDIFGPRPQ